MTPENKIKASINVLLKSFDLDGHLYYHRSVPVGYGISTLDYIGAFYGHPFAIEAKKPKGKPTARQNIIIAQMNRAGIKTFVVDGPESLMELKQCLDKIARQNRPS